MDEDSDLITCSTHGKREPAYICKHLHEHPDQEWYSELQSKDNLHPDAWCARCESTFQKLGGWSDDSDDKPQITLVCVSCYEHLRGQSVAPVTEAVSDKWTEFVQSCSERLSVKQENLRQQYKIDEHKRWDWDLDNRTLIFSNDGVAAVTAEIDFVGSISTTSNTWLWAWANSSLSDLTDNISMHVSKVGAESNFVKLTTPLWPADEVDGWQMTAVCADILDCKGAYRTPSETGYTYLIIRNIEWVS